VSPETTKAPQSAIHYEPPTQYAMTQLLGREQTMQLFAALEHQRRARLQPNAESPRAVKVRKGAQGAPAEAQRLETGALTEAAGETCPWARKTFRNNAHDQFILQQRQEDFWLTEDSRLVNVLRARSFGLALELRVDDMRLERGPFL
jgi:hypothetical protein